MEEKKSGQAELESRRVQSFLLGLIFVLASIFVALEYTEYDSDLLDDPDLIEALDRDLEMAPVEEQQQDMIALVEEKAPVKNERLNIVEEEEPLQQFEQEEERLEGSEDDFVPDAEPEPLDKNPEATDMEDNPLGFRIVEELPQFPGGAVEFMKWLTRNLKYPMSAQNQKIQGKVMTQFIVNKDGTVSDLKVIQSLNPVCDREALRVLRMMPKWKAGQQDGKPCRTMVCIPIVFKL